jgi:cell division protein ZapA
MNKTKNYRINIFGDQYNLISDESQEHITKTAAMVDALMKEIADKSKLSDAKKIAVLAALQLANSLAHVESERNTNNDVKEKLIDRIEKELLSL